MTSRHQQPIAMEPSGHDPASQSGPTTAVPRRGTDTLRPRERRARICLPPLACEAAVARLQGQVWNWRFRAGALLHQSETVPSLDPLGWLQPHARDARTFWQDREHRLSLAGLGCAVELVAHSAQDHAILVRRIHTILEDRDAAFLGGLAFDGQDGRGEWQAFPAARFVLPAITLSRDGGQCQLSVNLLAPSRREFVFRQAQLIQMLGQLRFLPPAAETGNPPRITRRVDDMSFAAGRQRIETILAAIAGGRLHKAVLARRVELRLAAPLDPFLFLKRWHNSNPGSFCFAMERADTLFMGCSPERLYRRNRRELQTESLAGTVRRGRTREEDACMENRLHHDPKLVHEHALVTRFVRSQIEPWVTRTESPAAAGVFKLDRIQHRHLPIRATLRRGVLDDDLLHALHPTPAVCGFPRREAQALIQSQETVQRGWYSGAFGIVSPHQAEFAVAIRSVLLNPERILCYSGVGIVEGSEPQTEWHELEAKIESLLSVLGG